MAAFLAWVNAMDRADRDQQGQRGWNPSGADIWTMPRRCWNNEAMLKLLAGIVMAPVALLLSVAAFAELDRQFYGPDADYDN